MLAPRMLLFRLARGGMVRCLGVLCVQVFRIQVVHVFKVFGVWVVHVFGFRVQVFGFQVFRCFGVFKCSRVMTFRKIKRVTKEGGPKMAKISGGAKIQDLGLLFGQKSASDS